MSPTDSATSSDVHAEWTKGQPSVFGQCQRCAEKVVAVNPNGDCFPCWRDAYKCEPVRINIFKARFNAWRVKRRLRSGKL